MVFKWNSIFLLLHNVLSVVNIICDKLNYFISTECACSNAVDLLLISRKQNSFSFFRLAGLRYVVVIWLREEWQIGRRKSGAARVLHLSFLVVLCTVLWKNYAFSENGLINLILQ